MDDVKKSPVCRVCLNSDLKKNGKGLSIFEKQNKFVISDKINAVANVDIKEGDGLPDRICAACLLDLDTAYNFKLKCESTNQVLLSALNAPTKLEDELSMKEEFLSDVDFDYLDDNITLADLKTEVIQATDCKPSRAINLKLRCDDCGGSFKSKCKLRVHWKRVHLVEKLKCSSCLRKFKTFQAFNSHKKQNSKSCVMAGQVHIEGEGKTRTFQCKECDYKSLRIKDVITHAVVHTGERPFQCEVCSKKYTQLCSLQSHMESAHKAYIIEGTCHYCGKHIQGRNKLYKHMAQHRNTGHSCKICNSVLKTKYCLREHMRRHSGVKAYACEVCPKTFFTISELSNHKTNVHLKSKQYSCDICQYMAFKSDVMIRHKAKHLPTNVACNICGMFLENELQLLLHRKRHTDRNYPCSQCDKTYYSRKHLTAHVRSKHRIVMLSDKITKVNSVKSESVE